MTTPFAELEARLRRWPGYMGSAPVENGLQIMWQGGFHIPGLPNFTSAGGKTIPVNVLIVGARGYESNQAMIERLKKVSGFLGAATVMRWFGKPKFEVRWLPDHGIPPLPAGTWVRIVEQVQAFKGALVGLGLGAVTLAGGLALALAGGATDAAVLLGGPQKRPRYRTFRFENRKTGQIISVEARNKAGAEKWLTQFSMYAPNWRNWSMIPR
jgi:hypothetical protein